MYRINATYNKITTIVKTEICVVNGEIIDKGSKVWSIRAKRDFFKWVAGEEAMEVTVSQNLKGFISKMNALGFTTEVSDFGSDRYRVFCTK